MKKYLYFIFIFMMSLLCFAKININESVKLATDYVGDMTYFSNNFNKKPGKLIWKYNTNVIDFYKEIAVYKNRIYLVGSYKMFDAFLFCMDPEGQKLLWKSDVTTDFDVKIYEQSSPVCYENKVLFGTDENRMSCVDSETGEVIWRYGEFDSGSCSPVVYKNKVFIGGRSGDFYCLDLTSGKLLWKYKDESAELFGIVSTACAINGKVFFGTFSGYVYCLNSKNGKPIWIKKPKKDNLSESIFTSILYRKGKIFYGNDNKIFYCVNAENGKTRWTYACDSRITGSPYFAYGNIYFNSSKDYFYCINSQTGLLTWKHKVKNYDNYNSPVVVNRYAYFTSSDQVYCFNAINGKLLWFYKPDGQILSGPVIIGNHLYIIADGLYCIAVNGDGYAYYPTNSGMSKIY